MKEPIWFEQDGVAVALLPKVASTSIYNWMDGDVIQPLSDPLSVKRRVAWVREPLDRLISAFSFFHHMTRKGQCGHCPRDKADTWEVFIDYTFSVPDPHWNLQVDLLTQNGVFLPTELYRFEEIQATWPFPGKLPWLQGVRHVEVDLKYRRDEIDAKYAKDTSLWLSAAR